MAFAGRAAACNQTSRIAESRRTLWGVAGDSGLAPLNRGSVGAPGLRVAPETQTLALVVVQAFFVGLAFGLLCSIASTLLVCEYGSAGLRIVYVPVGVVVPFVTVGVNALEERLPLSRFLLNTVGSLYCMMLRRAQASAIYDAGA